MSTPYQNHRRSGQGGMTLIEVLITIAVMAALFVIIYGTFNASRKTYAYVTKIQDRWHVVRSGMHRLTQDLSMAYVSVNENRFATERRTFFRLTDGDHGPELRFSAFAHRRLVRDANESDQCVIQYYLAQDPDDSSKTSLFRRETRRVANEKVEEIPGEAWVVIDDVIDLKFDFFDKRNDKWVEEWDTTTADGQPDRIPNQIRIYLTIPNENKEEITLVTMVAPPLTEALNFSPAQAGWSAPGTSNSRSRNTSRTKKRKRK